MAERAGLYRNERGEKGVRKAERSKDASKHFVI